jgi:hypothetical protein
MVGWLCPPAMYIKMAFLDIAYEEKKFERHFCKNGYLKRN